MKSSHIFAQILQYIRWEAFENIVQKYSGDHAAKGISCRSQFITMLFAYISGADSLREITQGMAMQGGNLNHMGIDRTPSKSYVKKVKILDIKVEVEKGNPKRLKSIKLVADSGALLYFANDSEQ